MQTQKVSVAKENRALDILDDVNVDEKTLEFLKETFGETVGATSDESKSHTPPEDGLVAVGSDNILAQDVTTTRNKLDRILKLRKFVLREIVESEQASAMYIRQLILCKKLFETDLESSDPLLKQEEIDDLFYKLDDVKSVMDELCGRLEEALVNWSAGVRIFPAYKCVLDRMTLLAAYEKNLIRARKVIEKKGGPEVLEDIISGDIPIIDKSFEELLETPSRLQKRVAYSINELLKYTPEEHNDYDEMKNVLPGLAHLMDYSVNQPKDSDGNTANYILKSGYIVQLKDNVRKLRYLFLFPTCVIITKPHISHGTVWYGIKDIILLDAMHWRVVDNPVTGNDPGKDAMKNLAETKSDLERFLRNSDSKQTILKKWKINRLKKRIYKNEAKLMLYTPIIKLTIQETKKHIHFDFFLTSHFDADDWIEILAYARKKVTGIPHKEDVYRNSIKNFRLLPRLTAFKPEATVNRYLNGTLDVYIHDLKGFDKPQSSYLTIQADCFGGFFLTVYKTKVCNNKIEPLFNQKFAVLLDSSHLLRISLYIASNDSNNDTLQGSSILDMQTASLHSGYRLVTLPLNPQHSILVALSIRYAYHQVGYKRKYSAIPSHSLEKVKNMRGRVFEEQLKTVTERENRKVPLVVTSCAEEIAARGLTEVNIYAIPGNADQVEELMAIFDLCSLTGARYLKDKKYSPSTIATLLQTYLQKLPSSLLYEPAKYVAAFDCTDKQMKHNKIVSLIRRMPDPEYAVFRYMIDHLILVSRNESKNKMGVAALSAALGPSMLTEDSIKDSFKAIIEYIMRIKINGTDF